MGGGGLKHKRGKRLDGRGWTRGTQGRDCFRWIPMVTRTLVSTSSVPVLAEPCRASPSPGTNERRLTLRPPPLRLAQPADPITAYGPDPGPVHPGCAASCVYSRPWLLSLSFALKCSLIAALSTVPSLECC